MKTIGRYQIKSQLGTGGMADVHLAFDPVMEREVAIKVLQSTQHDFDRFQREITVSAKLEGVPVVPVHDAGQHEGRPFLVMQYMRGGTLKSRLEAGAMTLAETAGILDRISEGLSVVHAKGIIHRDIKPANILFDEKQKAYLADFGIVRLSSGSGHTTNSSIGTILYMSPEQINNQDSLDQRCDIYALGAVFFEMLTGKPPYLGDAVGIIYQHLKAPIPNILNICPDLPRFSQVIMERTMAKDRNERYSDVTEFREALHLLAHQAQQGNLEETINIAPDFRYSLPNTEVAVNLVSGNVSQKAPFEEHAISESISSFNVYRRALLNSTVDLRQLRSYADKLALQPVILEQIDEVLTRVENDYFSIAVVGEFKRGKSTFLNALMGQEILPADILPCSATLNRVTYGLNPSVKIVFKGDNDQDGPVEYIDIDQLKEYVTKLTPESAEKASQIKEAVVYYPLPYCRNNVDIIDTPGLNDDEAMTAVTLRVLPKIDAAILVIMPEAPFAQTEAEFLSKLLLNDLGRVIFVVTALDRLRRPQDRERVLQGIEQRIDASIKKRAAAQFGDGTEEYELFCKRIGRPNVFGLSALQALDAKEEKNEALLLKSGFLEFETALEKFLTREKGAIVVQILVDRLVASSNEISKNIDMAETALRMKQDEFEEKYHAAVAELDILRQRSQEELRRIDAAAQRTQDETQLLVEKLPDNLKQVAEKAIDDARITENDLGRKNIEDFMIYLGNQVSRMIQQSGKTIGEEIQQSVQRNLEQEIDRLHGFATGVDSSLREIQVSFSHVSVSTGASTTGLGTGVAAGLAVWTGFGGIWTGYKEAGIKGAAVGGVASVGTSIGAGLLMGVLALPVTWPAIIAVGIASAFTGRWLTRKVFSSTQVENFRHNYKQTVFQEIDNALLEQRVDITISEHITSTFSTLKRKINQDVEASLGQTQATLEELRARRERHESLSEHELAEYAQIRKEVEKIHRRARGLSQQLTHT